MTFTNATTEMISEPIQLPVVNKDGASLETIVIDPSEFGGKINRTLLHEAILMYQTNQRAGTHSTLRRGEVAGSTKKLFRQKGTGNARVGTKRTNKRRGGGTAKGPKPRDYEYHLPRKALQAATRMAILAKMKDKQVIVIDELSLPAIKTKEMSQILGKLSLGGVSCLIGTAERNEIVYKSARNLPGVQTLPAAELNCYAILRPKKMIITRAALEKLRNKTKV